MKLQQYIDDQAAIQKLLLHPMGSGIDAVRENCIALMVEAVELLNETNWKPWRSTEKRVDRHRLLLEVVDTMKFLMNILSELDIKEHEFDRAWQSKTVKIKQRYKDGY